jgi:Carboxypeptidase regulatory-like domain
MNFDKGKQVGAKVPSLAVVLLAVFFCVPARSQPGPSEAAPPTPTALPSHALSGVVLNAVTGEPVRRAMVQAAPTNGAGPEISLLTDSEGRFEFPAMPESDVNILVHKPGFFGDLELHPSDFQPQIVHLNADTPPLTLKLLPEGVVLGHVATLKGEPIEDTTVRVLREAATNGYRRWESRGQAVTDEDGQFRIVNLIPGQYLLVAGPNLPGIRRVRNRSPLQEGFASMFYPGVPDLESATPFVISAGQQVRADFAVKLETIYHVSGTVVGFVPGSGVGIQFASRSGEMIPAPIDVDMQTGKFQGAIPAGNYILQVRGSDSSGRLSASDVPIVVKGDVEGIFLPVGSAISMAVKVDPRPSGGSADRAVGSVLPTRDLAVSTVRLVSTELRIDPVEFQADRNEQGALAFRNLLPGHYSVEITPTAPWCVKSATSGGTDLLHEELVIGSGRRVEPIEVVLRDDSANLRGQIRQDGRPAGGYVILFSDQASLVHAQTMQLSPGADFYFPGLAPGDYKLLAFDTLDGLEFRNPETIGPYLSKAAAITLHANEIGTINVERMSVSK